MFDRLLANLDDSHGGQGVTKVMSRAVVIFFLAVGLALPVYGFATDNPNWWVGIPVAVLALAYLAKYLLAGRNSDAR